MEILSWSFSTKRTSECLHHNALTRERFEKGAREGENEEHRAYNPRMRKESCESTN